MFLQLIKTEELTNLAINSKILNINFSSKLKFQENFNKIYIKDKAIQEEYLSELLETIRKPKAINSFENLEFDYYDKFDQKESKSWTILIYIAGDNDLYKFAIRNIEQLKQLGSNEKLNIVVHFDFHQEGKSKETRRFYILKNKLLQIGSLKAMDSGSDNTLINAAEWAIKDFPSEHFGIVLWNHGSGDLNPAKIRHLINPSELFKYNPENKLIELDRSISFMDFLNLKLIDRGICFDDSTGNYLDDEKLTKALTEITNILGKKIDIIMMDACLMAGIGTASILCPYVDFMTASEEVVLGPGYNYTAMLKPLTHYYISPMSFSKHIVDAFYMTYAPVTQDYTESALNLVHVEKLIENINDFCNKSIYFMSIDASKIIKKTLLLCGSKDLCTHFDEPSYIDLKHFYNNVLSYTSRIKFKDARGNDFFDEISLIIKNGIEIIEKLIFHSVSGRNYLRASGLSIYFPQGPNIHSSFANTVFGKKSLWLKLLQKLKS